VKNIFLCRIGRSSAFFLLAALWVASPILGQVSTSLFVSTKDVLGDPPPGVLEMFDVEINFSGLAENPGLLDIELPSRGIVTITRDLFEPRLALSGSLSYLWRGRSSDGMHFAVLTMVDGVMSGLVIEATGHFIIRRSVTGYQLVEIDLPYFPEDDDVVPVPETRASSFTTSVLGLVQESRSFRQGSLEGPVILDLLFPFTDQARIDAGGAVGEPADDADIRAKIQGGVDDANLTLENSLVNVRIRTAHVGRVDSFVPTGNGGLDLGLLRVNTDINAMRDEHEADAVLAVLRNTGSQVPYCGLATLQSIDCSGRCFEAYSYGYVSQECLRFFTPIHELAHLLGSLHNQPIVPVPLDSYFFAWAHAVSASKDPFKTVVAVGPQPRKPYLSHPLVNYLGQPTGTGEHYNARVIELRAPGMDDYRGALSPYLFADGFEIIDTGAWSEVVGESE
jgi:hypothetical protein